MSHVSVTGACPCRFLCTRKLASRIPRPSSCWKSSVNKSSSKASKRGLVWMVMLSLYSMRQTMPRSTKKSPIRWMSGLTPARRITPWCARRNTPACQPRPICVRLTSNQSLTCIWKAQTSTVAGSSPVCSPAVPLMAMHLTKRC